MDYTIADEMTALIPSKAVRQYVLDTGWKFTDAEKVALLEFCSGLTLAEKHLWMRRLADKTCDKELKKKLVGWVELEEQLIRQAPENNEHRYYYSLEARRDGRWNPECYTTWDSALAEGKARCTEYNTGFTIHKMLPEDKMPPDEAWEQDDELYLTCYYDIHGELEYISYNYSCDYSWEFIKMWFEYPNPFEKGDIIKTHWGLYGIVETTQQNWKLMMDRYRKDSFGDISDNQIRIMGLDEETGCFHDYYDDIFPFDLEYYTPHENWREDHGSMDKLLMCASLYMRGEGSLDDLLTATMEYREKRTEGEHLLQVVADILGKNVWMTRDEIIEQANAEDQEKLKTHFYNVIYDFLASGRAQSISCSDKGHPAYSCDKSRPTEFIYEIYYCGLEEKVFSHHWMI